MILLIDNYDSFTYNLVQRLGELDAALDVRVYRNDQITPERVAELGPSHLIISPGPCTPREAGVSNEVLRRFAGDAPVTVHAPNDWRAPYASGSAKVDGYVICPCSMGTAGTIASGTMSNLIHRAASVALKEGRKLVLVPRETPLSDIHLENLLRLRRAGAVILMAAPGFYNAPGSIEDLIEFVVGRCLDQLGIDNRLTRRWGQE